MLKNYRKILDTQESERNYIRKEIKALKKHSKAIQKKVLRKEKALIFIREIAIQTQNQLSFNVNEMVSDGLNSVFDQIYGFDAAFGLKRDQPECVMKFNKKGKLVDPLEFSGLGAADVAAFCLRASCLSMARKYRRILLLDEPFQRLKGVNENKRVIDLMRTISEKLNIQIICVNDERAAREDIIAGADRVFYVEQKNEKSKVTIL